MCLRDTSVQHNSTEKTHRNIAPKHGTDTPCGLAAASLLADARAPASQQDQAETACSAPPLRLHARAAPSAAQQALQHMPAAPFSMPFYGCGTALTIVIIHSISCRYFAQKNVIDICQIKAILCLRHMSITKHPAQGAVRTKGGSYALQ